MDQEAAPGFDKIEVKIANVPALSHARNLELEVPVSYRVDGSYIKIESFIPTVHLIASKQMPSRDVSQVFGGSTQFALDSATMSNVLYYDGGIGVKSRNNEINHRPKN